MTPIPPFRRTTFSGPRMVILCAIVFAMTGPGQTLGVSVFIDPMMAELGLSRGRISGAYLVGTLVSAAMVPFIGRGVDRFGIRTSMAVAGSGFAVALLTLSRVSGVLTLVLGFIAIRMLGQSSLSLISTNALAPWFDRRRGTAIGVTSAAGTLLMAVIPLAATFIMAKVGWRLTWAALGFLVLATVVPIALIGIISRPADVGQRADGRKSLKTPRSTTRSATTARPAEFSMTRAEAMRSPLFWAISGGLIVTGVLTTGLFFHQIDILGEHPVADERLPLRRCAGHRASLVGVRNGATTGASARQVLGACAILAVAGYRHRPPDPRAGPTTSTHQRSGLSRTRSRI